MLAGVLLFTVLLAKWIFSLEVDEWFTMWFSVRYWLVLELFKGLSEKWVVCLVVV